MGLVGLWQTNNYLRMPLQTFQYDSFYSFITTKNIHWHVQRDFIVCIPSPLGDGVGVFSHFSALYRRDLGHIGILGGNWHLSVGDVFQVGLENLLYALK